MSKSNIFKDPIARGIIAIGLSFAPMLSLGAATRFITAVIFAFCLELKLDPKPEKICDIIPCKNTLSLMMTELSENLLFYVRKKSEKSSLHIAMDGANKGDLHYVIKVLSFWDFEDDELFSY